LYIIKAKIEEQKRFEVIMKGVFNMANKDAYYFSHDSNALTDPKILSMRCDYGLERLWFILGNIRNVKKRIYI